MKSNNLHYIVFRDREHRTLTTAQSKERIRGKKPSASLSFTRKRGWETRVKALASAFYKLM